MEHITLIIELLQIAIGVREELSLNPTKEQWKDIRRFAERNSLSGLFFYSIECLPHEQRPDKAIVMSLFAQSEIYKRKYKQHYDVSIRLANLFSALGIETFVLKGYSIAQYYPKPELRYSCDLDLFVEKGWDKACKLLESKGISLEYEVYKEVEFEIDNVYVELHRFITPIRGNDNLHQLEIFLRDLLSKHKDYIDNSALINPPLMFVIMLYLEHALGDFLKAHLTFKHIVDWIILRKLSFDRVELKDNCARFRFDRFLNLLDDIADFAEGKLKYDDLSDKHRRIFDELVYQKGKVKKKQTWFKRRVDLSLEIISNAKRFNDYGYCSMSSFLFNAVWSHFFQKTIKFNP